MLRRRTKIRVLRNNNVNLIKRALKYLRNYKVKFALAFICIITVTILGLIQPIVWGKVLASLFEKETYKWIRFVAILATLYIGRYVLGFFQSYLLTYLNENIILDIKKDLYDKILNLPVKAFDEIPVGQFISRMQGDTMEIANIITNQFLNTIVDIIKVISIGIIVFTINVPMSLVVLAIFPLSYLLFVKYGLILKGKNRELSKFVDTYYSNLTESIMGIREIKGLGIKRHKFNSFTLMAEDLRDKKVSMNIHSNTSLILSNMLSLVSLIVVMLLGGYYIYRGALTMDYYIAFSSYASEFSASLLNITKLNSNLQQIFVSLERIFGLMDNLNYKKETFGNINMKDMKGNIKFEDVTFGYNEGVSVLNNISFVVKSKSKTAIVGSSGSGKTTIFNLLSSFYPVTSGEIFIDGVSLSNISEESLRQQVSIVRQEPFIFSGTIKENLKIAMPNASEEDICKSCACAYIHDYIMSLPKGYDTIIGENGVNLSGGQKQRIAIARALLKKSKIVLFDEATSALDNESQQYIKMAIDEMANSCTVLIIAHRLSTIIDADNIIVLEKSKIHGEGKHEFLIRNNDIYKRLYESELNMIQKKADFVS